MLQLRYILFLFIFGIQVYVNVCCFIVFLILGDMYLNVIYCKLYYSFMFIFIFYEINFILICI